MILDYFKETTVNGIRYQFARANDDFWRKWNRNKYALGEAGISLTSELDVNQKKIWTVVRATKNSESLIPSPVRFLPYIVRDTSKLYSHQIPAVSGLIASLLSNRFALDGSDTGIGKTYTALKTAILTGLQPAIICTKTGIVPWKRACAYFGISPICIFNWESSIGRIFKKKHVITNITQPPNKYISMDYDRYTGKPVYKWRIPESAKTVIIFDEIHKANGNGTSCQRIVLQAKLQGYNLIGLSATPADSLAKLRMIGTLTNLFEYDKFSSWLEAHGCFINNYNEWEPLAEKEILLNISKYIYPNYGVRVRKSEVPGFPDCQNIAQLYHIDKADVQNTKYLELEKRIEIIKNKKVAKGEFEILALRMQYRQLAESYKIPLLFDLAREYVDAGHSVIIFTCFVATLETIVKKLKTECYITGGQTPAHRQKAISDFGTDKARILVSNVQAGGVAVDGLQDLLGVYSRVALIPPIDDAILLKQTLGRIHRTNAKSKSTNILVYSASTVEEKIFANVHNKLTNIDLLNDGDLAATKTFN